LTRGAKMRKGQPIDPSKKSTVTLHQRWLPI
jgi:hypothetical protein